MPDSSTVVTSSPDPPPHENVKVFPLVCGESPPSLAKETSLPSCVPPAPDIDSRPAGASNLTAHSSPSSLYDCWSSTCRPDCACAAVGKNKASAHAAAQYALTTGPPRAEAGSRASLRSR